MPRRQVDTDDTDDTDDNEDSGTTPGPQAFDAVDTEPRRAQLRRDVSLFVGSVAVLVFTSALASADEISTLEEEVFRFVNEWPESIEAPTWPLMQAGSFVAIVVSALAVAVLWRNFRLAGALALAGVGAWVAAKFVKEIIERERPAGLLDEVIERPAWEGLGFVSGHAAVAFALATVAVPYVAGGWRWLLWGVAASTAVLRVYTGAHLPLDVIGGAALGIAVGAAVDLLLRVPGESGEGRDRNAP
jgi:undecaprenyl-diphosphatase